MAININRQLKDCHGRSRFKHVIHTTRTYKEELNMAISQLVDNITLNEKSSSNTEQIRGGQNCEDTKSPSYINEPSRYHESTHCLQFSDLWSGTILYNLMAFNINLCFVTFRYDVNRLESATYHHSVTISIYEKYTNDNKPTYKKIISKIK